MSLPQLPQRVFAAGMAGPQTRYSSLCGLGAGATQTLIDTSSQIPMIGASGAIAGVMGAYIVLFPQGQIRIALPAMLGGTQSVSAWVMIGLWFVSRFLNGMASLNGLASFVGGVAFWAHVGGFISGTLLVWLFKDQTSVDRQRAEQEAQATQRAPTTAPPLMGGRRG